MKRLLSLVAILLMAAAFMTACGSNGITTCHTNMEITRVGNDRAGFTLEFQVQGNEKVFQLEDGDIDRYLLVPGDVASFCEAGDYNHSELINSFKVVKYKNTPSAPTAATTPGVTSGIPNAEPGAVTSFTVVSHAP